MSVWIGRSWSARVGRVALTAGIAAGLLVPTGTASAAPSSAPATNRAVALTRFPDFAALSDSAGLRTPVLLHGTLTISGGVPLSGAQVLLSAWPSRETNRALPLNGNFATVPVARTVADRDGSFVLRSAVTPLLASLLGKEGLDIEIWVIHAGRQWDYLSNIHPIRDLGAWVASLTDNIDVAASTRANARNLLDIALDPAMGEQLPGDLLRAARLGVSGKIDGDPFSGDHMFPGRWCTDYKKIRFIPRVRETIAIASARNGAAAQVTYAKGASTESSASASVNGGISFGVAGSRSHTSEIVTDYAPLPSKLGGAAQRRYLIEVDHYTFEKRCMTDMQARTYKSFFKTTPDATVGSDWEPMATPTWKCTDENSVRGGGNTVANKARAYRYQKAFGLSPLGGVDFAGNTLSGYTEEMSIGFTFERTGRGLWCGHSDRPTANGQMVQGYIP